jgi:hypothetical protein
MVHFGAPLFLTILNKRKTLVSALLTRVYERGRRDSNPQPSDRQAFAQNSQVIENTVVTRIAKSDLAENLACICGQFPDLEVVIKTWRILPKELRKAIIKMIS